MSNKVFTRKKIRELALLMFDSGHLTLPEHESLLTEWFEQNPIGDEELLDSYLGLYDDYQSLIVGKMRIDKELMAHQYWANWIAQDANGGWTWFDNNPQVREDTFGCSNYGRFESLLPATDWKDTLLQSLKQLENNMNQVYTPEKVRELAFQLKYCTSAEREEILTQWFEQNQPEQLEVNWGDAPKDTHYARLQVEWLNKMNQQTGFSVLSKSERPHPMPQAEVKETVVRRSTHPFARSQQYMPDWTNWVHEDGTCFWHE